MATSRTTDGSHFKVAFIGTGGRSVPYGQEYAACSEIDIVAIADPAEASRRAFVAGAGLGEATAQYEDWRDLVKNHSQLDGVVIASPNYLHVEHAVPFLERGLAVVIEKPLATTQEDCERIIEAERANGARTLVGFVLRSAPFYRQIHDVVRSGALGNITAIVADELVRWVVTSMLMRGHWRRHRALSGGALLEKCCHDLDVLNWILDSRPVSLNSYGSRQVFNGNPALPDTCDRCKVASDCLYFHADRQASAGEAGDKALHKYLKEEGRCIYNIDKDVVDVQNVSIEYESGAVVNFLLNLNCGGSCGGRNIRIVGHRGTLWGCLNDMKFTTYDNLTDRETTHPIVTDGSGHGGGDRRHALELLAMMRDPAYRPAENAMAGYLSAVMCFAAETSRLERRRVDFRYKANGFVDVV